MDGHSPSDDMAHHPYTTASSPSAPIQAKLVISEAGDPCEQEADQIAEQVVNQIHHSPELETSTAISPSSQDNGRSQGRSQPIQRKSAPEIRANPSTEPEQQLQIPQSGGQPLTRDLQTQMGQHLGADISRVRIHTDSKADALNHSVQAQAFTSNRDIFFRQGAYQPNSKAGQKLIAHELVHTVQQGGSPIIQRRPMTPVLSAAHQSLQTSTHFLQRKPVTVVAKTSLHEIENGKDKGKKTGSQVLPQTIIEISDNDNDHIKDSHGKIRWFYTNEKGGGYIRASKVLEKPSDSPQLNSANPKGKEDLLGGFNESILGTVGGSVSAQSQSINDAHEEAKKSGEIAPDAESPDTSELDITAGTFGVVTGLLGMALSLKKIFGNSEKGLPELIARASRSAFVGLGKTTAAISGIVSASLEKGSGEADRAGAASSWSGGFAGAIETLSGAVKTMRQVIKWIQMWSKDDKYSKPEHFKAGSDIVSGALSTAKGGVESVKGFIDIFDGPTGKLGEAVPGLDIAISAVKMVVQGYYLAESAVRWNKIRVIYPDLIAEKFGSSVNKEQLNRDRKEYKGRRTQLSNLEYRKKSKETKNESRQAVFENLKQKKEDLETAKVTIADRIDTWRQEKSSLPAGDPKIKELDQNIKKGEKQIKRIDDQLYGTKWTSGIVEKQNNLKQKIGSTEHKIIDAKDKIADKSVADTKWEEDDFEEIDLAKELKSGNRKRIIRQSIHLGVELTKIAGSIAELSGVGAETGIVLKASATGVDVSLPFFRSLKQYGRKKAAKNQAKGNEGTLSQRVFNADKSDMAKLSERKRHTLTIFKMVQNIDEGQTTAEKEKKARKAQVFIEATGCDVQQLCRLNGEPEKQASLILQSFYKREF